MPVLALWHRLKTSPARRAYERLPAGLKTLYRFTNWYPDWLHWRLHPAGFRHSKSLLAPLRDKYRGHRAIIMGNGPSLRTTPWELLRDEFTIGTNRIYLLRRDMRFDPTFYICVNHLVLGQFSHEIQSLASFRVIDWRAGHRLLAADDRTAFLPERSAERFFHDVSRGWSIGYTVTFAALQLAYFLGFSRVILIGVDHRFSSPGPPMREVTASGPDLNHFSPDYFGAGVRWHLPNLAGSEEFYRLARVAYEQTGRIILDATRGGKLDVFQKTSLEDALAARAVHSAPTDPLELAH